MGFMSRAAKRAGRQIYRAGIRANDQRLRQRGPTHGYGPDGRYGRIGQEHKPKWGASEYVALILLLTAGVLAVVFVGALLSA
jgi:hypothetical protein